VKGRRLNRLTNAAFILNFEEASLSLFTIFATRSGSLTGGFSVKGVQRYRRLENRPNFLQAERQFFSCLPCPLPKRLIPSAQETFHALNSNICRRALIRAFLLSPTRFPVGQALGAKKIRRSLQLISKNLQYSKRQYCNFASSIFKIKFSTL
jgi:hypothetical protein